jgi:hypothetical protein
MKKKPANPISDYNYIPNPTKRKRLAEPVTPESRSTQSVVTANNGSVPLKSVFGRLLKDLSNLPSKRYENRAPCASLNQSCFLNSTPYSKHFQTRRMTAKIIDNQLQFYRTSATCIIVSPHLL